MSSGATSSAGRAKKAYGEDAPKLQLFRTVKQRMATEAKNLPIRLLLSLTVILFSSSEALASRGLGSDPQQINILAIKSIAPNGLKLAQGWVTYNDGDTLTGVFRIYCPTKMIRPTNYKLQDRNGIVKQTGKWWQESFKPKWNVEYELVRYVCSSSDFGFIQ